MRHRVNFTIPPRRLGKADARFVVEQNGKAHGELGISKGAVVWFPKNHTYGYKLDWTELDDLMRSRGTKSERR